MLVIRQLTYTISKERWGRTVDRLLVASATRSRGMHFTWLEVPRSTRTAMAHHAPVVCRKGISRVQALLLEFKDQLQSQPAVNYWQIYSMPKQEICNLGLEPGFAFSGVEPILDPVCRMHRYLPPDYCRWSDYWEFRRYAYVCCTPPVVNDEEFSVIITGVVSEVERASVTCFFKLKMSKQMGQEKPRSSCSRDCNLRFAAN